MQFLHISIGIRMMVQQVRFMKILQKIRHLKSMKVLASKLHRNATDTILLAGQK